MTKLWSTLVIALLINITGCTTVKTFQKMSPDQRATAVCEKQDHIIESVQKKKALEASIADSTQALSRGYRIHQQCQEVKVYGQATMSCSTLGNNTSCSEYRPESYEKRCTEVPVSLSPELERSNISQWSQALQFLNQKLISDWSRCYDFIYKMPPEEAYEYY
jgi:hypothetical protein